MEILSEPGGEAEVADVAESFGVDPDELIAALRAPEDEEERDLTDEEWAKVDAFAQMFATSISAHPRGVRREWAEIARLPEGAIEAAVERALFIAECLPSPEAVGAPFHVHTGHGWARGKNEQALHDEDIDAHILGNTLIAPSWPARVRSIEIDLDRKTDEQRETIAARVRAVEAALGPGILWRSSDSKTAGLRYRVQLTEFVDSRALASAVAARLKERGVVLGGKSGVEVWPRGAHTLRAPAGAGSALAMFDDADELLCASCSVEAFALLSQKVRRPVADVLPGFVESESTPVDSARPPTREEQIAATINTGAFTSLRLIRSAVGGKTDRVERYLRACISAGLLAKVDGVYRMRGAIIADTETILGDTEGGDSRETRESQLKAPTYEGGDAWGTRGAMRRAPMYADVVRPPCPSCLAGEKNKSQRVDNSQRVEGRDSRSTLQRDKRDTGGEKSGPTVSHLDFARDVELTGFQRGARFDGEQAVTLLWASEGLSDDEAVSRMRVLLNHPETSSKDLLPSASPLPPDATMAQIAEYEASIALRAAMLDRVPGRMAELREQWARAGHAPRAPKRPGNGSTPNPLVSVPADARSRRALRELLSADDRAWLDARLTAAGIELDATRRGWLEVLFAAIRSAGSTTGCVAVCRMMVTRITGGRMWADPLTGERRKSSATLVRVAQRIGLLGEQVGRASPGARVARIFDVAALPSATVPRSDDEAPGRTQTRSVDPGPVVRSLGPAGAIVSRSPLGEIRSTARG